MHGVCRYKVVLSFQLLSFFPHKAYLGLVIHTSHLMPLSPLGLHLGLLFPLMISSLDFGAACCGPYLILAALTGL